MSRLSFTDSISARMMLNVSRSYIGMSGDESTSGGTRELTSSLTRIFPLMRRCRAAIQPFICSSLASSVSLVEESASLSCFVGGWSTLVSVGGMSGDWLVIFVLGTALSTSSTVEAELPDSVVSLMLGLCSPSGSSNEARRSGST